MQSTEEKIIENLKRLIKTSDLSQNQVAVKAGMTPQRLSNVINRRGQVKPSEIEALSNALGCQITEIYSH